jgi:hypothetical protein
MKENLDIFSSNLINKDINNNIEYDSSIKKLQQNLFLMGFDILMINKIISYFNITSESEAIDYLIKDEEGMWNHPFIPKEKLRIETDNSLLNPQKIVMNNVLTRIKSSSINEAANNNIIIENDICDICEESIDFHRIKKYEIKHSVNSKNSDNKNNDLIKFEEDKEINNNNNNNILIDEDEDKKDEKEEEINQDECPICMDSFENPIEIENCKHKFCSDCFNSYLDNLISTNQIDTIPCPRNKCSNNNISEEFFSQYLSEEQYFKYRQFKSKNEIARDSKKIFCPICDSYAQLNNQSAIPDPNSPNYVKYTLKCQNSHEFCSCGRPLHEGDCFQDEQEFKELIISEKIKKCPKCGFLIKKNYGCNHMTCGNPICKYEFCWLCMNEAVPNHYDFGPCAGKQFFDPESFENRIRETHPKLYEVVKVILIILRVLNFFLCFFLVPALGFSLFAYFILYVEEEDIIHDKKIKFIEFLICICVSLYSQSFGYMFWILVFVGIALALGLIPIGFIIFGIFFACSYRSQEVNQEPDMIELANSMDNEDNVPHDANSENNNNNN